MKYNLLEYLFFVGLVSLLASIALIMVYQTMIYHTIGGSQGIYLINQDNVYKDKLIYCNITKMGVARRWFWMCDDNQRYNGIYLNNVQTIRKIDPPELLAVFNNTYERKLKEKLK